MSPRRLRMTGWSIVSMQLASKAVFRISLNVIFGQTGSIARIPFERRIEMGKAHPWPIPHPSMSRSRVYARPPIGFLWKLAREIKKRWTTLPPRVAVRPRFRSVFIVPIRPKKISLIWTPPEGSERPQTGLAGRRIRYARTFKYKGVSVIIDEGTRCFAVGINYGGFDDQTTASRECICLGVFVVRIWIVGLCLFVSE